jgi:uncharacterized protein (TIRG00374 family)
VKNPRRLLFTVLRLAVAVALLAYLGLSGAINWLTLRGLVEAWPMTIAGLLLLFLATVLTAWRLSLLLNPQGFHLSLLASTRLTLMGTFFNTFLPGAGGGDVVKIYYGAAGNQGKRTEIVTIMLIDRAAGMFALITLPLLIVVLSPRLIETIPVVKGVLILAAAIAMLMVIGFGLGMSSRVRNFHLTQWAFEKVPLGNYMETILNTLHSYRRSFGVLIVAVVISWLAHALAISVFLFLSRAINSSASIYQVGLLVPIGLLVNMIPLTPGGLGVGEAAFDQLFGLAGLGGGAELLLGWRLLLIIVGLLGLTLYLQGSQRLVKETVPTSNATEDVPVL